MKRWEEFNQIEGKRSTLEEQAKGMLKAHIEEFGDCGDSEKRLEIYKGWLGEEVQM